MCLSILDTHGDADYVGLAGLQLLLGSTCVPAELTAPRLGTRAAAGAARLSAEPPDLSAVGYSGEARTLDKLLDGINDSTDEKHMWLAPRTQHPEAPNTLSIDLGAPAQLAGLRVWNYNKSPEDALRGARTVRVSVDGTVLGCVELRRAAGCDGIDSSQTLLFREIRSWGAAEPSGAGVGGVNKRRVAFVPPAVRQDYEPPLLPSGLLWQFTLLSNWHDPYYMGLDAIEFYDATGARIDLATAGGLSCVPHSLRDIGTRDSRSPENLLLGGDTRALSPTHAPDAAGAGGARAWLAPLAQSMTAVERAQCVSFCARTGAPVEAAVSADAVKFFPNNVLVVSFDVPVRVSFLRLFNYSKTASRGVREFSLHVDGRLCYMGTLQQAPIEFSTGPSRLPGAAVQRRGQAVCFTTSPSIIAREGLKTAVHYCGLDVQDVLCIDERVVKVRARGMYDKPSATSAGVTVDIEKRPMTAIVG